MSTYLGRCGHCGANKNNENFKSRPAGRHFDVEKWLLRDDSGRKLQFFLDNHKFDRVCNGCYVKNNKLVQASQPMLRLSPISQGPPRKRREIFDLSHRRAASYRRRLGAEFRAKKCDVAAKP